MKYEIFISRKPVDGRTIKEIKDLPVLTARSTGQKEIFFSTQLNLTHRADAIVTDKSTHWIGVLTADALPVFLIGEKAVAVIHASWKNLYKGLVFETVKYIERFSIILSAFLGISICENCYLVGRNVFEKFSEKYRVCFKQTDNENYFFNLKEAASIQLTMAGVKNIGRLDGCTVCDNQFYHSYRKEKTDKRILSAIRIIR